MKCKVRDCKRMTVLACVYCGKGVCRWHSRGWPAGIPVCGKCLLRQKGVRS